jgi:folate-dependent phosphoribosylglycinamide formyltransferase PurN
MRRDCHRDRTNPIIPSPRTIQLQFGAKITGCTVHLADNEYDHGPIILQKAVPVDEDDDADSLAARVFESEKDALPEALQLFADGRLRLENEKRIRILPHAAHTANVAHTDILT